MFDDNVEHLVRAERDAIDFKCREPTTGLKRSTDATGGHCRFGE